MKLLTSVAFGAALFASQAFSATLSIVGGTATTLPSDYNPVPVIAGTVADSSEGAGDGSAILAFTAADVGPGVGLNLTGSGRVTFTFLGKEASATNTAVELAGGTSLSNNGTAGDSIAGNFSDGILSFLFGTLSGDPAESSTIANGGGVTGPLGEHLGIAFLQESNRSVLAFFGDGRGDFDFDDMVIRISTVPLPAGMLLMFTALGGLGVAARRRKS